jgi:hypothetical protein
MTGCNLLNYLVELADMQGGSATEKLYRLLAYVLEEDARCLAYSKTLFKEWPESVSNIAGRKFDFMELRDKFVHRGEQILEYEQFQLLFDNIFVVNELLRMVILHLDKIPHKELGEKVVIPVKDMQESMKLRREIFGT